MKVNTTGGRRTPTRRREVLPEGTYLVKCDFVERTISSKKGTPMLLFTIVVTAGPHKGKKVLDRCYLLESSIWRLQAIALALGVVAEFDTDDQASLLEHFCGKNAIVVVGHETWSAENADGIVEENTRAQVRTWRATAETAAKLKELKLQAPEDVTSDTDAPVEEEPPF